MAEYDSSDKQPMDKSEPYIPERHIPAAFRDEGRMENVHDTPGSYWPGEEGHVGPRPKKDHPL